jgi:glycosyltransferase involved in cell wall biosynthesis
VKIALFSPVALSSAIGRVTALVVQALIEQRHDVVVIRTEDGVDLSAEARPMNCRIVSWEAAHRVQEVAQAADTVVYQIGDSYHFHRGCIEWLPRIPGIVCLHDYFVGSLFRAWGVAHRRDADSILRLWYGKQIADRYFSFHDPETFVARTSATAPMTEWVASMASGVLTHSSWAIERVLRSCPGPVRVAPLPYDILFSGPQEAGAKRSSEFVILTVGHVNANKRVESVVRAIADSERLRATTVYRVVGRVEPAVAHRLEDLAKSLGVRLSMSGSVTDDVLRAALDEADVICSLRLPALEAASASAIEAMLYGKAVVVMNTGFYEELPDDVVRKVSPEREIFELREQLEGLLEDPQERRALGRRAAAWAARTFRADSYAESLIDLSSGVARATPALETSRFIAKTLMRWGGNAGLVSAADIVEPLRILERSG